MTSFPTKIDTDLDIPRVDAGITELLPDTVNALRDAMFAVENNIGTNAQGSLGSISQRLSISIQNDGYIRPSALTGIGLVALPITDAQVSPTAGIQESKLNLTYTTGSLFTLYTNLNNAISIINNFLSVTGIKVEPHIAGTAYNHLLSHIHIDPATAFLKTVPIPNTQSIGTAVGNRNTTNLNTLSKDISDDLIVHEKADGSSNVLPASGGTVPPLNYAHNSSGIFVNSSGFSTIPQTNNDVQKVINFIDSTNLLLFGNRTQNLFSNGVSRVSRSSSLTSDGYGSSVVSPTLATAYFLNVPPGPIASSPVDHFNHGDDVILFTPTVAQLSTFNFDAQFAQVQPGDILTINYGTGTAYQFVVESTKKTIVGINRTYAVRINGKNPISSSAAIARIDRPLFNRNKYGALASARVPNSIGSYETLIIANPRSAMALGNGFDASAIGPLNYKLYLTLIPKGDVSLAIPLPAIDVTGNKGATPGLYTLDSIIDATNKAFRAPGFNYRFIAFGYNGQFGIMLADSFNNASFSIISGTVDTNGNYTSSSLGGYQFNVVDNYNIIDPLGIGVGGSNIASPPVAVSYTSVNAAAFAPSLIFSPLKRNFYYTNGSERDKLKSDPLLLNGLVDSFGDGYWLATVAAVNVLPNRVQVVYTINSDISDSNIKAGSTIVVQPNSPTNTGTVDYGRFIVEQVSLNNCGQTNAYANITVYDAVHGTGISPYITLAAGSLVDIYFSDDTVSFNSENVFDSSATGPYKRFFENYVDGSGHTFTHERARFLISGSAISNINIIGISPKLRGYSTNSDIEIRLSINNYDTTTGNYDGYLARYNPSSLTLSNTSLPVLGKKGEVVRFYDETTIDYIDVIFDINDSVTSFSSQFIDIQLFKSLQLDEESMVISTCQVNDSSKQVSYLKDIRQFGTTSEEQFTTSAIDFINSSDRLLRENGVINGLSVSSSPNGEVSIVGGTALVNGKIIQINNINITIPTLQESANGNTINTINWFVCINDKSEIELVASTDYDLSLSGTYGSLDHNRIFFVINPQASSPSPYAVRSSYLSKIISQQKDLLPIYVVSATLSGSPLAITTQTVTDIRRYATNGYGGLAEPFVLGQIDHGGSFRRIQTLNNYLIQLLSFVSGQSGANEIGTKVIVKGQHTIVSSINLDFPSKVSFVGDGGEFVVTTGTGFTIGNNIEFNNLKFTYSYNATGDGSFTSSNPVNYLKACIICNVSSSVGNKNININNCYFTSQFLNRFAFIAFRLSSSACNLENVNISNNRFDTTSNSDDTSAIISISGPSTSPSGYNSARITNVKIINNICNKNQLISVSSFNNGTNILDAICAVNLQINGNVCGAINVLTRYAVPFNLPNASFIKDKYNLTIIDSNNCRFIYSGSDVGLITSPGIATIFNTGIFSGSTIISNNSCSWIHSSLRVPSGYSLDIPTIVLDNNKLTAADRSYLSTYYGGSGPNTAIIVDEITGA
jgi:hypothetical protein